MDSAKNAVKEFMSKDGKHDTTVHQTNAPAVTNERVDTHRHDNVTTAVDREVHQDHYHHTVQPIQDKQRLEEQHHHHMAPIEHRKHEHGNDEDVQRRLEQEKAKYQDSSVKGETRHTSSAAPVVSGTHQHHHVHETIQPVIQRQTIEPHVVHTTVPIHETHHNSAQHHDTTALPAMSMADFKKQGGAIGGADTTTQYFEGEPRNANGPHIGQKAPGEESSEFRQTGHVGQHGHGGSGTTGSGLTGNHHNTGSGITGDRETAGSGLTGDRHHNGSGLTGNNTGAGISGDRNGTESGLVGKHHNTGSGLTDDRSGGVSGGHGIDSPNSSNLGSTGTNTSNTKPSLLDRVNPFKDSDGDGKKGMMD